MKKYLMSFFVALALPAISLVVAAPASAHPGGLDKNGCHHDTKTSEYHCHKGPNAGKSAPSEEAMLGAGGAPMESNTTSKREGNSQRDMSQKNGPTRGGNSRKQKASNTETESNTQETSQSTNMKEQAGSDKPAKKSRTRKKSKAADADASDTTTSKSKKSKKAKSKKSDDSATDTETKPKKSKKKTKSSLTDDTTSKE